MSDWIFDIAPISLKEFLKIASIVVGISSILIISSLIINPNQ